MLDHYILDGHRALPVTFEQWLDWAKKEEEMGRDYRRVASTKESGVHVSTVFLCMNHARNPGERPLIFETMIFGGAHDQYQDRCSTWEEAEEMHKKACALAFGAQP